MSIPGNASKFNTVQTTWLPTWIFFVRYCAIPNHVQNSVYGFKKHPVVDIKTKNYYLFEKSVSTWQKILRKPNMTKHVVKNCVAMATREALDAKLFQNLV